jgi:hypothetical protein
MVAAMVPPNTIIMPGTLKNIEIDEPNDIAIKIMLTPEIRPIKVEKLIKLEILI